MIETSQTYLVESEQFDSEQRRYDDTVTWLAEVLPGSMRVPIEYTFDGEELYASDGSLVRKFFSDSIEAARDLPDFEYRRRIIEMEEFENMIAMAKGEGPNTMVVVSDFPPELMNANEDLGGYNVKRKQTMMRVIYRTEEGKIKMRTQSLDLSDRQGLENIYWELGFIPSEGELLGQRMHLELTQTDQDFLVDKLTGVYDRALESSMGGNWYAGIKDSKRQNTYDFVCSQDDLINAYLATSSGFSGGIKDYRLAAAIKDRYIGRTSKPEYVVNFSGGNFIASHAMAIYEMEQAGKSASVRGETFSGCGASVAAADSASEQLGKSGFGNKADKLPDDKYGTRYFKCPKGHENVRRVKNQLIERCQKCGCSVRC